MANYLESTQLRCWTFASLDDLATLRAEVRAKASETAAKRKLEPLSEDAERGFLGAYLGTIRKLCQREELNPLLSHAKYSDRLFWTAATLFKRFFLRHSVMEYNPALMSTVAIYVAGKAEEIPLTAGLRGIKVNKLAERAQLDPALIVDNEINFLGGIDFQMVCFHPTRALAGFLDKLEAERKDHRAVWSALREKAGALLDKALLTTDLVFLQSPSRLALACLTAAHGRLGDAGSVTKEQLVAWALPPGVPADAALLDKLDVAERQLEHELAAYGPCAALVKKGKRSEALTAWATFWRQEFENARVRGDKRKRN